MDDLEALLASDGILVVECSDAPQEVSGYLEIYDEREYGNTRLLFYIRKQTEI